METESSLDADETRDPILTLEGKLHFTRVMLDAYHDASRRLTDEAEALIAEALDRREQAFRMLERANELAYEYARAKDTADEEIPW